MEKILIGSDIETQGAFHTQMKILLNLQDYYGDNLDALWDCLTTWIDLPINLIWLDYDISKKNIGEYAVKAIQVFQAAEVEVKGFSFEMK